MRPLFADPKTDFVFKKIFGSEEHKPLLIALLNDLLELDHAHRIVDVELLGPEQRPKVEELKLSIVDVKCIDARGTRYVVEMQVLNVEGFDKRVVYNVAKAYVGQLEAGDRYPDLNDVIGVTICDFELWPARGAPSVPMLSRWRMQEQHGGTLGMGHLQFVFLELPKLDVSKAPQTMVDKWAYFFREASKLRAVPDALAHEPFTGALDLARVASFTADEWDGYVRAGMALQDERGALSVARKESEAIGEARGRDLGRQEGEAIGEARGRRQARVQAVVEVLRRRGIALTDDQRARILACDDEGHLATLEDRAWSVLAASDLWA